MSEIATTTPAFDKIADALAKAQAKMTNPVKTHEATVQRSKDKGGGVSHRYKYATLAEVIDSTRAPLAENGLSVTQLTVLADGKLTLVTRLLHASGQYMDSVYPLPSGAAPQEMGSAITYARRYSLCAILGIAADEDDDGAKAGDVQGGQDDRDTLVNLMGEASLGNKAVMDYCRANNLGDGRTTEDLSAETVRKLVDTWPAVTAAIKSAPKAPPAKQETAAAPEKQADKPAEKSDELPGLPDLTGLDPALADAMSMAGVSKAQLKAYYVGAKHLPATVEPEKLPPTYLKQLLAPANWKKAVEAMTKLI